MNEKKEKFIIFALAGILLLIVCLPVKKKEGGQTLGNADVGIGSSLSSEEGEKTDKGDNAREMEQAAAASDMNDYVSCMEQELEELLTCMEGVGRVKVMITLKSTGEEIVEKDRPSERSNMTEDDGTGGSRNTNDLSSQESTVFVTDGEGRQIPYVRKTMQPEVEGVAVLAEGGGSEMVKNNISEAIQALFDIDANKIKIAKMKVMK